MEKRYEIFVSSTYTDLKPERQIVRDIIVRGGNFPVGMEDFIGGRPSWEIIEKAIRSCDYYILLIGGRYGSINPDSPNGYSFTECEFRLAQELRKPILVAALSPQGLDILCRKKPNMVEVKLQKYQDFRNAALKIQALFWTDINEFKVTTSGTIPLWLVQNHLPEGGWVRAKEYERIKEKLRKEQSHKSVYTYLFNRLNPYDDISLTLELVEQLSRDFKTMPDVIRVVEWLIKFYVKELIDAPIRVYFAYSINEQHITRDWWQKKDEKVNEPVYRLGISNSRDGIWQQGKIVKGQSNIHNVYRKCQILDIDDSSRQSISPNKLNLPVSDEGSVVAAPVYGVAQRFPVGVIGLNSPNIDEAPKFLGLVRELSVLLSSLFFSYGKQLKPQKGFRKDDKSVTLRLREEIIEYFNDVLGKEADILK